MRRWAFTPGKARAANQNGDQQRQTGTQPGIDRLLTKHRGNVQQRGNAHHNEKIVADQPVELVERKSEGHQPITNGMLANTGCVPVWRC